MAVFGGMIASSVVKEVIGKLASPVWEQIGLHWDFKDDMDDMMENLEMIQCVLVDAEEKSLTDKAVCLWLKKLKFAAYDIEDMMCDFETKIPSNKEGGLGGWLQQIKHSAMMGKKRVDLVEQMKKMRKRLSNIAARRSQFVLSIGNSFNKESVVKERETFSTVNENTILGRDDEKVVLMRRLKQSNDGENAFIIAIVGIGGIGKTTLAQLIYNDKWVEAFNIRAWVYVSMEFDLQKIAKALLESFGGTPQEVSGQNLETITKNLKGKISGEKYFIVLDDLWEENGGKLDRLKDMLNGGITGSKIIVTTRSENVAKLIGAALTHKIKVLSDDFCWELFCKKAFPSLSEKNDKDLEVVRRKVVNMCGGIPLAVTALGHTARLNDIDALLEVQDSKMWKLTEPRVGSSTIDIMSSTIDIMSSLKLSYYFMPSGLKLCFGYCSIYSKGYSISKEELIQQWIALGFIPEENGVPLVMRGEWYVNYLLSMSFFQEESPYHSDTLLKMHDLVHDLARCVIGNELLILDTKNDTNIFDHHRYAYFPYFESPTCVQPTHSKLRAIHWDCDAFSIITQKNKIDFSVHKYLRVLNFNPIFWSITMPNSIGKMKQLRYLYARNARLKVLPESFGDLINLRYLCMSANNFKKLPVSFGNLTNLEVLILNSCEELEHLPEPLNLVSLRELYLQSCLKLRKLPNSVNNLTKLEILDVSNCENLFITPSFLCILKKLAKLNMEGSLYPMSLDSFHGLPTNFFFVLPTDPFLTRKKYLSEKCFTTDLNNGGDALEGIIYPWLEIACFENVNKPKDVANARLWTRPLLTNVKINWIHSDSQSIEEMSWDEAILEYLKLPQSIRSLTLEGYSARKFPNISRLTLENLEACEHLSPLGHLPNLSNLSMRDMPNLRKIDEEFMGKGRVRNYHTLSLISLLNLEQWSIGDATVEIMIIRECPKLRFEPLFPMSRTCIIDRSLEVFYSRSSQNKLHFRLPTHSLKISHYDNATFPNIGQCMKSLKYLTINSCKNLKEIPPWLAELTSLRILHIMICNSLNNFPLFLLELPFIKLICIESSNDELLEQCSKDNRLTVAWKYNAWLYGDDQDENKNDIVSGCREYLDYYREGMSMNGYLELLNIDDGIGNNHTEFQDEKCILFDKVPPKLNEYEFDESTSGDYDMDAVISRDPITNVSQEAHVASADPQQPSRGKKQLTAKEKGKGLLIESHKKQSRDVRGPVPLGGFMIDARNRRQKHLTTKISKAPSAEGDTTTCDNHQTENKRCSDKPNVECHGDEGPQDVPPLNAVLEPAFADDVEMLNATFERLELEKLGQGKRNSSTKEKDKEKRQKTTWKWRLCSDEDTAVSGQPTGGLLNQSTQKSAWKWRLCSDEDTAVINRLQKKKPHNN